MCPHMYWAGPEKASNTPGDVWGAGPNKASLLFYKVSVLFYKASALFYKVSVHTTCLL